MKRVPFLLAIVGLMSLSLAGPVMAATPGNDTYATRTTIASLPFTDSVDTAEATTADEDIDVASYCSAPAFDASVWYEITATSDNGLLIDAGKSDYSVGIIVSTGTPGAFNLVDCAAYGLIIPTTAGETYTILVFDYQGDGGGNGGQLELSVSELPPPPTVDVTIAPTGTFNAKTGIATLHGTVTCSSADKYGSGYMYLGLSQNIGRVRISGDGYAEFVCDGSTQTWSAEITGYNGKFGGGKASATLYASACGVTCTDVFLPPTAVSLRK